MAKGITIKRYNSQITGTDKWEDIYPKTTIERVENLSTQLANIIAKFDDYLLLAGGVMAGTLNMGNKYITNLAAPTADSHAVNRKYLTDNYYTKTAADSRYAPSSHNHDDRYYTETESDNKYLIKRSGVAQVGNVSVDTSGLFPLAITTAKTAIGMEYNILLNAQRKGYTFTQSGSAQLTTARVWALFDGALSPQYSTEGLDPSNPYVLTIENLPNIHTQTGGVFGWTARYWIPTVYKVEAYNNYKPSGMSEPLGWQTWVNQTTPLATQSLVIPINEMMYLYNGRSISGGNFTKIRITIYNSNGAYASGTTLRKWGLSEIFFIHPEAQSVHQYLEVTWAKRLSTPRTIAGVSFDGSSNIAIPFANLSNKPTTLAGYGITDAASSNHNHDSRYYQQVSGLQNVVASSLFIGHSGSTTLGFGGKFKVLTKLASGELQEEELQLPATPTFADIYVNNITGSDGAKGLVYFSRSSGASQLSFDFGHTHFETYSTISTYYPNDVVFYSNRYYKRIGSGSTVGKAPTVTAYWSLLDLDNRYATAGHDHSGVYEPAFSKNTGFNRNFGTTAGTVAEGNHKHDSLYSPVGHTHDDRYVKTVDERPVLRRSRPVNQHLTSTSSSIDLSISLSTGTTLMIEVNSHSSYQYTPKIVQITLGSSAHNQLHGKATFTNYCAGTMEIYSFSVHYYQNRLTFSNIEKLVGTFNSSTKTIEWTTNSSAPLYVGRVWTV